MTSFEANDKNAIEFSSTDLVVNNNLNWDGRSSVPVRGRKGETQEDYGLEPSEARLPANSHQEWTVLLVWASGKGAEREHSMEATTGIGNGASGNRATESRAG